MNKGLRKKGIYIIYSDNVLIYHPFHIHDPPNMKCERSESQTRQIIYSDIRNIKLNF